MTEQTTPYTGYGVPEPGVGQAVPANAPYADNPPYSDAEDTSAKDKATESAQAGKEAATDVAHTAAEQAKEVAGQAQQQVRQVAGEARDQLRSHAGDQHRNAVTNLRSLGDELRSMAENGQRDGMAAELVGQVADRAHGAADWLDRRQPEDLLDELRRVARRRPGAFLVGALAAGVVAGRLTRGAVASHQDGDSTAELPSRETSVSDDGGHGRHVYGGDAAPAGFDVPGQGGMA